jgi:hypothetical protein
LLCVGVASLALFTLLSRCRTIVGGRRDVIVRTSSAYATDTQTVKIPDADLY